MPAVCRKSDSLSTGHSCDSTTILATPAQGTVYINGRLVARITDKTISHDIKVGLACVPHVHQVKAGSGTVYTEGLKTARIGDAVDSGNMTSGSPNVFAG